MASRTSGRWLYTSTVRASRATGVLTAMRLAREISGVPDRL
jgi:hypothetical protein